MPRDKAKKTLAVIGQGYVGLPLAMAAVKAGWNVIGVDSSASKVAAINNPPPAHVSAPADEPPPRNSRAGD